MRRGRLAIHAHFYQPERRDPFGGPVPRDPAAAPYSTWTERIIAECYRPNEQLGNLERISYNVGPTLTAALAADDPAMLARIANAHGENALAQGFHHSILPLAGPRDRRTEVRWGLRDHEVRFGRAATGFWLPETAADKLTLRILAEEGVRYTILAPWQAAMPGIEARRPHRVDLGGGLSLVVVFFDADLSGAVSFRPEVTADADRFAREWVIPRVSAPLRPDGRLSRPDESPLVVLATDGELYGHHQPFRDLFLQRLVDPAIDRGFDVVTLGEALADLDDRSLPAVRLAERTSWSCHHGLLRWSAECPCAPDTRWKQPLRAALERLAGAIDAVAETRLAGLDPWAARDAYVDVLVGLVTSEAYSAPGAGGADGSPALAPGHVRQRRLVLGRPGAARDETGSALRRARSQAGGRAGGEPPRAASGRGPGGPRLADAGRRRGGNLSRGARRGRSGPRLTRGTDRA
jgi:hypothetical protein